MAESELRFFSSWICLVDFLSVVLLNFSVCDLRVWRVLESDAKLGSPSHLLRFPATTADMLCRLAMVSFSVSSVVRSASKKQSSRLRCFAGFFLKTSRQSLSLSLAPMLAKRRSW